MGIRLGGGIRGPTSTSNNDLEKVDVRMVQKTVNTRNAFQCVFWGTTAKKRRTEPYCQDLYSRKKGSR